MADSADASNERPSGLKGVESTAKLIVSLLGAGGTIFGYLAGLAKTSQSVYNPIDTAFIFVSCITFAVYAVTFLAVMMLGAVAALNNGELPDWVLIAAAPLIAVIAIPAALSVAGDWVREESLDVIGLTFVRFVGLGATILACYLIWKYVVKQDKPK